jgi:distribution and morphology protein 34
MAFNFNWSPLVADTYRAREMLTAALNKSPKPPIIVDDVVVTELNLGETAPDLEILEIGDLAEDRFRGIFKMAYSGDAFLTLKTRVQANPLNTYLSAKPTFTSPQPLAAASGLTIPLQITLSEFRLSGFVILVFSRQKGLTIVFRNDPLESLKVSSTFDSIPFVRDYLQRTIEEQLRNLFMEDLPAILHKLSLRLWSPDYCELEDVLDNKQDDNGTKPIDPLANPLQDPINSTDSLIQPISLDSPTETHATFSQKNLLRLAALSESHHTLSLFTPSIRDAVFRAWAGSNERSSGTHTPSLAHSLPSLSRLNSAYGSTSSIASIDTFADSEYFPRPTLSRSSSHHHFGQHSATNRHRKRKKRIINLRHADSATSASSAPVSAGTTPEPSIYPSSAPSAIIEEKEDDLQTPLEASPAHKTIRRVRSRSVGPTTPGSLERLSTATATVVDGVDQGSDNATTDFQSLPPPPAYTPPSPTSSKRLGKGPFKLVHTQPRGYTSAPSSASTASFPLLRSLSSDRLARGGSEYSFGSGSGSSGGILEQAWIQKMAREIARKVREERVRLEQAEAGGREGKRRDIDGGSNEAEVSPPPAYGAV